MLLGLPGPVWWDGGCTEGEENCDGKKVMRGLCDTKKVFFLCDSAAGGGAERVLTYLVNNVDRKNFSPSLFLLINPAKGYTIAPDVPVKFLAQEMSSPLMDYLLLVVGYIASLPYLLKPGKLIEQAGYFKDVLKQLVSGIRGLGRQLKQDAPDVMIVFLQNSIVVTLLACMIYRVNVPVCCSDRILLSQELNRRRFPRFNVRLLRFLFRRAAGFIAVSEEARQDLIINFQVPADRVRTIYNGLDLGEISAKSGEPLNEFEQQLIVPGYCHFVAVGRLSEQKHFSLLIKAFRKVRDEVPCRLLILGEGEQRTELEELVRQLNLNEDVVLMGWRENPFRIMRAADIFVLSSLYEGFPNVLLEAMAVGLPVISTKCPSGPAELLEEGEFGVLVPPDNVYALAHEMRKMAEDKAFRAHMAARAQERVRDFSLQRMIGQFEVYCEELVASSVRC